MDIQQYISQLKKSNPGKDFRYKVMRRYTRIIEFLDNRHPDLGIVFCFIDNETFDILAAKSWSAPVKDSKHGNLISGPWPVVSPQYINDELPKINVSDRIRIQ